MNKSPVILQFEGEDNYHTVVDLVMFNMDLEISHRASSVKAAKKLFEKIKSNKIKPEFALVSGYLERNQKDGVQVAKKLREICPSIKIVAYSVNPDADWGDDLAIKSHTEGENTLIKALERVTGHEFRGDNSEDPEKD